MAQLTGIRKPCIDGEVVFRQGDPAADMYVVRSGAVDVVLEADGGDTLLERIGPGGFFGEMALFAPGARSASAIARGETVLEAIDLPTFREFVGDPIIWSMFARLSERLRRTDKLAGEHGLHTDTD